MRWTLRMLAYLALSAAIATIVIDGTVAIASGAARFSAFGALVERLLGPTPIAALRAFVERTFHPILWDPLLASLFAAPAILVLLAIGVFLWMMTRERPQTIGFSPRD